MAVCAKADAVIVWKITKKRKILKIINLWKELNIGLNW